MGKKALQRVIKTPQNITGTHPESIRDICRVRSLDIAQRILKDCTPPDYRAA